MVLASVPVAVLTLLVLMVASASTTDDAETGDESCQRPPYFAFVHEDIPSELIESLTLEGRCYLACLDISPTITVNF